MDVGILNSLGYIEVIEISVWLGVMYYGKCWIDYKFKQGDIMAVSKHNLWKRKKNGLMKLVRSHRDWLERRRNARVRKIDDNRGSQWWDKPTRTKPVPSNKSNAGSQKRTQIGKKV